MITIHRLLARHIAAVFRRALALSGNRFSAHPVRLTAGPQGLSIESATANSAIVYRDSTPLPPAELLVPLELFKSCGGSKADALTISPTGDNKIAASWREGVIPRAAHWNEPDASKALSLPESPQAFTSNSSELLIALREAVATTADDPSRYALNCLQLRGETGEIAATDGRQLFKQNGFAFGFTEDVVIYGNEVFGAKEFADEQSIDVGRTETHLVFAVGPWSLYLPIEKERRFPRIDEAVPSVVNAQATLDMSRADVAFLAENLPRLPGGDTEFAPVTIDLNGCVAVRAQGAADPFPTELVLRDSQRSGEEIRLVIDRRYLERAAKLGFERVYWTSEKTPAVCRDDRRTFVWMPLEASSAVKSVAGTVVIESQQAKPSRLPTRIKHGAPVASPPPQSLAGKTSETEPPVIVSSSEASPTVLPSGIEQAVALRMTLRELLTRTDELVRSLKRQRQQQRLMKSTLANLRQLQSVT